MNNKRKILSELLTEIRNNSSELKKFHVSAPTSLHWGLLSDIWNSRFPKSSELAVIYIML